MAVDVMKLTDGRVFAHAASEFQDKKDLDANGASFVVLDNRNLIRLAYKMDHRRCKGPPFAMDCLPYQNLMRAMQLPPELKHTANPDQLRQVSEL